MQRPFAPGEPLAQLGHQGSTPLYMAAQQGHGEVLQQLIGAGPLGGGLEDLSAQGRKGVTLSGPPVEGPRVFREGGTLRGASLGGGEECSDPFLRDCVPT